MRTSPVPSLCVPTLASSASTDRGLELRTQTWAPLGAAAALAGVLLLAAMGTGPDELSVIAGASGRFLLGNALTFVGTALIGAGLLAIGHGCAEHGHRVASILSRVAGVGWLLHSALIAHNAVSYELAVFPDRVAAAELESQVYAGPVFLGLLLPMLALTVLGTIGAALALWRAGHMPVWVAACLGLAIVSDFIAPERFSGIPMFALLLAGFVGLWSSSRSAAGLSGTVGGLPREAVDARSA